MFKQKLRQFVDFYAANFKPKLFEILHKGYDLEKFKRDTLAGMTVAVVSIPLAMALAIASGVTPAQGLYTAIVAGFFIALLGGSKYQIGGPTGAFVVVIFNVVKNYGPEGLTLSMLIAGVILIVAGLLRLGTYIKYIPYPVVTGFTAGIGILLISTQMKDLLGLEMESVPTDFIPKWTAYFQNLDHFSFSSVVIALFSFGSIFYVRHRRPNLPAYLVAVVGATLLVAVFALFSAAPDTVGSKFGAIPHFLPMPHIPYVNWNLLLKVLPSGLTIAFLAGVESLLSATVIDGMSGDNHNSNAELIAEGVANLMSMCFSGVPATGAIARTATNYKSHAYSPIAGIMQSVILLLFMLLLAGVAKFIPLACLSAVLILVGWNMLGLTKIYYLLKGARGDALTMLVTLFLTVLVDLNTGISVGFILSSIIFMHRMSKEIEIETDEKALEYKGGGQDLTQVLREQGVVSIRFSGPLFFGDALDVSRFLQRLRETPRIIIIRMGYVPMVDISGANALVEFIKRVKKKHQTSIILSNVKKQPRRMLHEAFLQNGVSWHDVSTATTFENALKMTRRYLRMKAHQETSQSGEK
jgi:SulP family sulfate permease